MTARRPYAACLLAAVFAARAGAAPVTVALDPAHARVTFRAYALGLFPVDGAFDRFSGALAFDPAVPRDCHVMLDVDVDSLRMGDGAIRDDVLSRNLLDSATFPRLGFAGDCAGGAVMGALTMHGQTHALALAVTRSGSDVLAEASLERADWGVRGRPLLAGQTIRIGVTIRLPPDLAATLAPAPR